MKKVLDKALEARIKGIIEESENPPADIVALFKELQDPNGLKVCMNVNKEDAAYREV